MKVENTLIGVDAGQASRSKPAQTGSATFSDFLAKAVSGDGSDTSATSESPALATVSQATGGDLPPLWRQVDSLLQALGNYASALGDSSKTLKDLEPLTQDLEQRAEELDQGLGGSGLSGQGQDELTSLAVQAVTQARVEAFKFRRGDYL
jgi:ABC-type transporter Mla subunit MlaD